MITVVHKPLEQDTRGILPLLDRAHAENARRFHRTLADYAPTPLQPLDQLAGFLGIGKLWVKDESSRFGLKAFKALGGSYAIGRTLMDRLQEPEERMTVDYLRSQAVRERLGDITFITTTDGNHGASIAWTARLLGYPAVVYMPRGTAPERVQRIENLGAKVIVTDMGYDDTARLSFAEAERNGWLAAQDTTAPGYEQFPFYCMQGYTTMALEALESLEAAGERPTHVFVQAGAGTLTGAITAFFAEVYKGNPPQLVVIEAESYNALQRTAAAADGRNRTAPGSDDTIMAGLSVGEVCTVAWEALRCSATTYAAVDNPTAATGMRVLGAPMPGDPRIISGESGAVGVGLLYAALAEPAGADLRAQLKLDKDSKVLCFSTEGDTDPAGYRSVVWEGAHPLK